MSDKVEVKIGGKSQEEVAFMLASKLETINTTGEDFLKNFQRCLKIVRNPFQPD